MFGFEDEENDHADDDQEEEEDDFAFCGSSLVVCGLFKKVRVSSCMYGYNKQFG